MLDYLEGNLSPQDTLALKAFAILHPELELNFEDELVTLENNTISFKDKQNLKASFNDELVIGYMENVLNEKDKQLATELANTNLAFKHELGLYKKTIAAADTTIVFENKAQLKREARVIVFNQRVTLRVAAAIVLLFGIWFLVSRVIVNESTTTPVLAKKTQNNTPTNAKQNNTPKQVEINLAEQKLVASSNKQKNTSNISANNTHSNSIQPQENIVSTPTIQLANKSNEPVNRERITYIDTNALKLASNNVPEKTINKYIIEEGTDDELVAVTAKPSKNKLWDIASKALKKLNQRGIEKVNSSENTHEIFIGALTIAKTN